MASRIRFLAVLVLAMAVFCGACGKTPAETAGARQAVAAARPTIVFMTDFGTANDAVAVCKAVIVGIAPDARLMDITHQVTPFQIDEAARWLAGVTPYYPSGTVFLVVVDPGVGTSRKAVIVKIEEGTVFCAARQWSDHAGDRTGWIGLCARDYEHGLDAAAASFFDVSWT